MVGVSRPLSGTLRPSGWLYRSAMVNGADICVVGAGIVGLAVARELQARSPGAEIVVLERGPRIAAHQSGHTSGVIHAGIYYAPGSLKARLCVDGARRLYEFCDQRGVEARRSGKVIVAPTRASCPARRARGGGSQRVPGLRRIGAEEWRERASSRRRAAALLPATAS